MSQLKRLRLSGSQEISVTYSNHDDDDDNRMIIEHVNDDCLAEIFKYISPCERPKIALVCKKWKRALDNSWFNVKKLEFTFWRYDGYPRFLTENFQTIRGQFKLFKSLLHKCGYYLRELDMSLYPKCKILPVINDFCPNLEKLRIRFDHIDDNDNKTFLTNAFTNLSKLKVLKIIFDNCICKADPFIPLTLIKSLLNVADTLTDLIITNWISTCHWYVHLPEEITHVISQLKALKKFVISGLYSSQSLCDYIDDNPKTIEGICDDVGLIQSQFEPSTFLKNIELLETSRWPMTDDGIYNIANTMKQLHTIYLTCAWLTDTGIVALTKIHHLKSLNFIGFNNTTDSSIKLFRNMVNFQLPWSNKITDESVIEVLENSPDMENLVVRYTSVTHKFIEKAAQISRYRQKQLNIWITLEAHIQVEHEYLKIDYV